MNRSHQVKPGRPRAAVSGRSALLLLALLAAGCVRVPPPEAEYPLVIPAEPGQETTRLDPARILSAAVEGDLLRVEVEFGGGCRPHHFSLLHGGEFMESLPVQVRLQLAHDGHGDLCRALLRRTLVFDLSPLREAYLSAYGVGGTLVVHLVAPGGGESAAPALHYTF
jgi:hypothetical protein